MKTNPNDLMHSFPDGPSAGANNHGLTKREYFAGLAMQAILAESDIVTFGFGAQLAVEAADALIAKLNKLETK